MIETGFGKEFSEPPNVTVSGTRTHCEACQEPLEPSVMHKCHGNKHYEPPAFSSTEITELCPACMGEGALVERETFQAKTFVVVCKTCRTYVWPEVALQETAIQCWNTAPRNGREGWPRWLAGLSGDEQVRQESQSVKPSPPDMTNYKGVCPTCDGDGSFDNDCKYCNGSNPNCEVCGGTGKVLCEDCDGTGVIE